MMGGIRMGRFLSKVLILVLMVSLLSSSFSLSFAQKKYNEAPMFAELVKAGKLPPVEKRLPENPLVVKPVEEIGTYGGDLRIPLLGTADFGNMYWPLMRESLLKWDITGTKPIPNLAEKYGITRGGRVFTFYLRRRIKVV